MNEEKKRIALVLDYLISEYSETLLEGVRRACEQFDFEYLTFPITELHNSTDNFEYQNVATTAFLTSKNFDGIIFVSSTQMNYLTLEEITSYIKAFHPLPVVNISAELPGIPSIIIDSYKAYEVLVNELVENQDSKKFGIVGLNFNSTEINLRIENILKILKNKNFNDVKIWKTYFDYGLVMAELEKSYAQEKKFDYDVIFAMNDEMAYACIDFCNKIGLRVPEDVIVVGFDDLERSANYVPPLTSINQELYAQTYEAVRMLNDIFTKGSTEPVKVVDAKAVLRKSAIRNKVKNNKNDFMYVDRADLTNSKLKFINSEWFQKRSQIYQLNRYYSVMQFDMTMSQLSKKIEEEFKTFGITACAIVLYETPVEQTEHFDYFNLPHKAWVLSGYDYEAGYDSALLNETVRFDPNDTILPEGILKYDSRGMSVIALYHNAIQYGYLIYRKGEFDISIYDLLAKMTTSILYSVYSFELVNSEQTKVKELYNRLDVIASTDELTGLKNRRGLLELGQTTLDYSQAMNQSGVVAFCDMDGLKKINDTFGHEAGDLAIKTEADILKKHFRSNDIVARIGGDEFVIIAPGMTEDVFLRIKESIARDCKNWSELNRFTLSISMGFLTYPGDFGHDLNRLMSEADKLLYEEKRQKKMCTR